MELNTLLDQLVAYTEQKDQTNPEISQAPVIWHIDHSLKVINNVYRELTLSNPDEYAPEENKAKAYVLGKKTIKRGFAKAPEKVRPPAVIDPSAIDQQLEEARKNIKNFENLKADQFFPHFSLGHLN